MGIGRYRMSSIRRIQFCNNQESKDGVNNEEGWIRRRSEEQILERDVQTAPVFCSLLACYMVTIKLSQMQGRTIPIAIHMHSIT